MKKINTPVLYEEFDVLTTNREKELDLILRAHGINISVSKLKSLHKCLNLFYPNGTMELTKIFDIIDKMYNLVIKNLEKMRKEI